MAAKKSKRGGAREGAGRKPGAVKTARDLMTEMGCPIGWLPPVIFCLAVMNNDLAKLSPVVNKKTKKTTQPTWGQRLDAARIATPYLHQKLPEIMELGAAESWAEMVREGEERLLRMRRQHGKSND